MTQLDALYLTGKTNTVRIQADAAWKQCGECTDGIRTVDNVASNDGGGSIIALTEVCVTCDGTSHVADRSGLSYTVVFRRSSEMNYATFLEIWTKEYDTPLERVHAQISAHVLWWDFPDERPDTLARVLREMGVDQAELTIKDFNTNAQEDKEISRVKKLHDDIYAKLPTAPIPTEDPDILGFIRARWADELSLAIVEDQSEAFTVNLVTRNKTS